MLAIQVSLEFLSRVRNGEDTFEMRELLAKMPHNTLFEELSENDSRKAFWLNVFNGFNLMYLERDPSVLNGVLSRQAHFSEKKVPIAHEDLSLNDVFHGMLRSSRIVWSRGYLRKLFVDDFEEKLRLTHLDPRIHFALNWGGSSCPPIRFFYPERMEKDLNLATIAFLDASVKYDAQNKTLWLHKLFDLYLGDFGGKKGVLNFLKHYQEIPSDLSEVKLRYMHYSWKLTRKAFLF